VGVCRACAGRGRIAGRARTTAVGCGPPWGLIRCRRDGVRGRTMIRAGSCWRAHRERICHLRQPALSFTPTILIAGLGSLARHEIGGEAFAAQLVINRRLTHGPTP